MSTHQQTKPRRANQSITEESGRPGTARSNVGCDAIDEPCTKSTAGLPSGLPTNFSQRNRRTSPLRVQCSHTGYRGAVVHAVGLQSIFAPVSRTTLPHWSRSARKYVPNSAGVEPTISIPAVAM